MVDERLMSAGVKANKLTAAKSLAVPHEGILSQWLGQSVSNLVAGADTEDLDDPLVDVLSKVMVAHIDMFGERTKLRQMSKL
jgi:hypothetical protein